MAIIGAIVKLRVDGCEEHDVGTFTISLGGKNTPFTPLGKEAPTQFQSGVTEVSWTAEVEPKPGGTYAIDWTGWKRGKLDKTLVIVDGARSERLTGCVIDDLKFNYTRADGKKLLSVSGQGRQHSNV
jgi:hypothetical protein